VIRWLPLASARGMPSRMDDHVCRAVLAASGLRPNTQRSYLAAWSFFRDWAGVRLAFPAKPESVLAYIEHLTAQGLSKESSLQAWKAIGAVHRLCGLDDPTADPALRAKRRALLAGVPRSATRPLRADEIRDIVAAAARRSRSRMAHTHAPMVAARDCALILLCYLARLRPAQAVALSVEHVTLVPGGVMVLAGERRVWVRRAPMSRAEDCAVRAWQTWRQLSGVRWGPLFRSVNRWGTVRDGLDNGAVQHIVRQRAEDAGILYVCADSLHLGPDYERDSLLDGVRSHVPTMYPGEGV
jgi:integrase